MMEIHDYILGLSGPVTVEDMLPLIGEKFPVLQTGREWGEDVVSTDYLLVTDVKFMISVKTGQSTSVVMIYSDYFLKGRLKYNAWTGIKGVQNYIAALEAKDET